MDATLADAARELDHAPAPRGALAPLDFAEIVRRAASEESVVAEHQLGRFLETGAARAALVRTADGTYFVAVAETPLGRQLVSVSVDPASGFGHEARSWDDCLNAPLPQGACQEKAR
jgi:hypothetical protein